MVGAGYMQSQPACYPRNGALQRIDKTMVIYDYVGRSEEGKEAMEVSVAIKKSLRWKTRNRYNKYFDYTI